MSNPKNQQSDIDALHQQRELASKKLHLVQTQKILETRAEEKFRQEQIILEIRAELDSIDQELAQLTDALQPPAQIIFGVPNLPPNHLPRPEYLEEFRAALQQESIGLTGAAHVGVQGMGGLGKSVLAAALAHDEAVQVAFPDGIFWLTFGQQVKDDALLAHQNNILMLLGQQKPESSLELSRYRLHEVLRGKRCLFIIDDIWDSRHLKDFDLSDTPCRFLLTSRRADVLDRLSIEGKRIDLLTAEQALVMLARYAGCALEDLPQEATEIIKECGCLPLAVAAIGSMVKNKPLDRWQLALRKLQEAKLDKLACTFDTQYENLFQALQVSVEALPTAFQEYYKTLVVFPEDAEIPEAVVTLFWQHCGFSDDEPLDVIDALLDASLLTRIDEQSLRLHDLLRDYLISQIGDVAALHRQLLEAYKAKYPGGWHTIPHDEHVYFYRYWSFHIRAAEEMELATVIADSLIRQQPLLNLGEVMEAVQVVDYGLKDIAPSLLKKNQDPEVILHCLKISGRAVEEEAKQLIKENSDPYIIWQCLLILRSKAKEEARQLIRKNSDPYIICRSLNLLGDKAKEDAKRLIKENSDSNIIRLCSKILYGEAKEDTKQLLRADSDSYIIQQYPKILGDEAKEDARRLLRENFYPEVIQRCLEILGDEGKEEARRLIRENPDPYTILPCLKFLGDEVKEDTKRLLREYSDIDIISPCLEILGDEAKEEAERLLRKNSEPCIIQQCLYILGDEAREKAKRLLRENSSPVGIEYYLRFLGDKDKEEVKRLLRENFDPCIIQQCLYILGNDAKEEAKRLLRENSDPEVIRKCLTILGNDAKEEAKRLLRENSDPEVIRKCLTILGNDAKEEARRLLRENSDPEVIRKCLTILGHEAKEEAKRLLRENSDPNIIYYCLLTLSSKLHLYSKGRRIKKSERISFHNEAKEEIKWLIRRNSDPEVIRQCLKILGHEGKEEAIWLLKTSEDQEIRQVCKGILSLR